MPDTVLIMCLYNSMYNTLRSVMVYSHFVDEKIEAEVVNQSRVIRSFPVQALGCGEIVGRETDKAPILKGDYSLVGGY